MKITISILETNHQATRQYSSFICLSLAQSYTKISIAVPNLQFFSTFGTAITYFHFQNVLREFVFRLSK